MISASQRSGIVIVVGFGFAIEILVVLTMIVLLYYIYIDTKMLEYVLRIRMFEYSKNMRTL